MTEEQINIAIAESLGIHFESSTGCWHQKGSGYLPQRPNYYSSLDACAEFERRITLDQRHTYWNWLQRITERGRMAEPGWLTTTASAPHRCESYLRTVGKWEASA